LPGLGRHLEMEMDVGRPVVNSISPVNLSIEPSIELEQ
jgi:hypothetical protein